MTLILRLSCKDLLPGWRSAANWLQLVFALTFINARLSMVSSAVSPDVGIDNVINENYEKAVNSFANDVMEKRTWQQLQSAWGKRAASNNGWSIEPTDDDAILAERWIPVLAASGGTRSQRHPEVLKYTMIYLTNAAALKQLANRQEAESLNASEEDNDDKFNDDLFASADQSDHDSFLSEKRNWKSMNAAWGKRRNEPTWNKFRGAWGKREHGWNNLKGMWGKRASKDWQKLHTGWGKRSQDPMETN